MKRYFYLVFIGLATFVFASCEGPAGPPGANGLDGADGANGEVACLVCHGSENMNGIEIQFSQSGHYEGFYSRERTEEGGWSAGCSQCHSSEGFISFTTTGSGVAVAAPGKWECKTCHGIHQTFETTDYALRLTDAVEFESGNTADLGNSNLCMNCHQSRRTGPTDMGGEYVDLNGIEDDGPGGAGDDDEYLVPAGYFFINNTHYGPHHGAQANVMYGEGFAEVAGTFAYPTDGSHAHAGENGRCVGCHMATYGKGTGGHTWNPSLNGCNVASCHNGSVTKFDHNNKQTAIEDLLEELRDLLVAQGVVAIAENDTSYVWNPAEDQHDTIVTVGTTYHPVVGVFTVEQAQAFFNWIGIEEDRSLGIHNPAYVEAILENSIQAIE